MRFKFSSLVPYKEQYFTNETMIAQPANVIQIQLFFLILVYFQNLFKLELKGGNF